MFIYSRCRCAPVHQDNSGLRVALHIRDMTPPFTDNYFCFEAFLHHRYTTASSTRWAETTNIHVPELGFTCMCDSNPNPRAGAHPNMPASNSLTKPWLLETQPLSSSSPALSLHHWWHIWNAGHTKVLLTAPLLSRMCSLVQPVWSWVHESDLFASWAAAIVCAWIRGDFKQRAAVNIYYLVWFHAKEQRRGIGEDQGQGDCKCASWHLERVCR